MRNVVSLSLALALSGSAPAGEEEIKLTDVPPAVMAAFKARFKDAAPTGASKETDAGKVFYEVTFKADGRTVDVTLTAAGELVTIEKEVPAKSLPKAVTDVLGEKYPKAEYKLAEEVVKVEKGVEKLAYYEVLLATADKKLLELEVTPEGKVVATEEKTASDK